MRTILSQPGAPPLFNCKDGCAHAVSPEGFSYLAPPGPNGSSSLSVVHCVSIWGWFTHRAADSTSQYDAIRAYLKELDITDNVWIGLSKTGEKPNFIWTNFQPLTGEGHWHEAPSSISQDSPLCVATDAAADFQWRPLPCGGPDIASFICELPIPSWAAGPRGCLLTELPSLTVLYIPEQSALELTSDCGLDGTKRIACKGDADREEMLKQLTCTVSSEEFDDKSTKSSLISSTEYDTSSDSSTDSTAGRTTKASMWTSNTVDLDYGMPTRHRRETEDTLSPISTKSTFNQETTTDLSWKLHNHSSGPLTTTESHTASSSTTPQEETETSTVISDDTIEPVLLTSSIHLEAKSKLSTEFHENTQSAYTTKPPIIKTESTSKSPQLTEKSIREVTTTGKTVEVTSTQVTTKTPEVTVTQKSEVTTKSPEVTSKLQIIVTGKPEMTTLAPGMTTVVTSAMPEVTKEAEAEFPSAISQGQLFSIIENGTMFDIIELNETVVETSDQKSKMTTFLPSNPSKSTTTESNNIFTTVSFNKEPPHLTDFVTNKNEKKKAEKYVKKIIKKDNDPKIANFFPIKNSSKTKDVNTESPQTTTQLDLNKEFEMLPFVKDSSIKLNRTFRKELPPMDSEENNEYSVPKVIDFSISNSLNPDDPKVEINLHEEKNNKTLTETLVISSRKYQMTEEREKIEPNLSIPEDIETLESKPTSNDTTNIIDPKLDVLNGGEAGEAHQDVEEIHPAKLEVESRVTKQDFLPKSLLEEGDGPSKPPPTDDQPRPNRKRQLTRPQRKNFYPYFFSRMLG